eukprot:6630164-Prymnesium_polylepis.1
MDRPLLVGPDGASLCGARQRSRLLRAPAGPAARQPHVGPDAVAFGPSGRSARASARLEGREQATRRPRRRHHPRARARARRAVRNDPAVPAATVSSAAVPFGATIHSSA